MSASFADKFVAIKRELALAPTLKPVEGVRIANEDLGLEAQPGQTLSSQVDAILDALGITHASCVGAAAAASALAPAKLPASPAVTGVILPMTEAAITRFLIVFLLPFFYGAATRLPFIYFVIHLDKHFGAQITEQFGTKMLPIGLCVASYQFARVLTNILSLWAPRVSHLLGSCLGLAGFALVWFSDTNKLWSFVIGTVLVGFSETMSSMQVYVKQEYSEQLATLQVTMKIQYASVMFGVMFAFLFGGVIYQYYHINGVAAFGTLVLSIEVLGTSLYFLLMLQRRARMEPTPSDAAAAAEARREMTEPTPSDEAPIPRSKSWAQKTFQKAVRKLRFSKVVETAAYQERVKVDRFAKSGQSANWVAYLLAVTVGVEAVTIGYNLSIGPIFLLDEFGADISIIGVLFAAGATVGTVTAVSLTLTPWGNVALKHYLPAPFNIYLAMTGIGCSVLLAAVPNMAVHITGLLLLMGFNDLAATLLIEVQGAVTSNAAYYLVGPLGQIVRRSLNAVTAATGPLLFGLWPRAPHVVAGGVTLLWTAVFTVAIEIRRRTTQKILEAALKREQLDAITKMPWEAQEIACQIAELQGAKDAHQFLTEVKAMRSGDSHDNLVEAWVHGAQVWKRRDAMSKSSSLFSSARTPSGDHSVRDPSDINDTSSTSDPCAAEEKEEAWSI